jgi:[ribosomal protein S5]-alanine N-acetyltransferase
MNPSDGLQELDVNFSPFPVLHTGRMVLRRIEPTDADDLLFLRSDAAIMKYLDREPLHSVNEAALFIRRISDSLEHNEGITWGISLKDDTRLVGTIGFWRLMKEHFRAEIGYLLHPAYWGKGLVSEAITTVMDYGFNVMKLHSVEANVNPTNKASVRVLEKTGFVQEAYFRENYFYKGRFLDTLIFSRLTPYRE